MMCAGQCTAIFSHIDGRQWLGRTGTGRIRIVNGVRFVGRIWGIIVGIGRFHVNAIVIVAGKIRIER